MTPAERAAQRRRRHPFRREFFVRLVDVGRADGSQATPVTARDVLHAAHRYTKSPSEAARAFHST